MVLNVTMGFFLLFFLISESNQFENFFIQIFTWNLPNFLIISWIIVISVSLYFLPDKNWITTNYLFIWNVYRYILVNTLGMVRISLNMISFVVAMVLYLFKSFIAIIPIPQIWTALFKKNAYLFFLNGARAKWLLSKTQNIWKNK